MRNRLAGDAKRGSGWSLPRFANREPEGARILAVSPLADDPVLAVLSPPRVERFRALAGLERGDPVEADFTGWSKLVLLTPDLAVLFPRDHTMVEPLHLEVEALRAVSSAGLAEVPGVVGVWEDVGIGPYPVVAIDRLRGVVLKSLLPSCEPDELGFVLEQVGRLAARWHAVDTRPLESRPPRRLRHREGLEALLGTQPGSPDPGEAAQRVCEALGLGADDLRRAREAIRLARTLEPVVCHGDLHEAQLLVDLDDHRVTGVLDWQTAVVDHPFTEFDLGQWGETIWQRHRGAFPALRRRQWAAYARERDLPEELAAAFEWIWCVSHAMRLEREASSGQATTPEVLGTLEEAIGRLREAACDLSI